jgi:hypothetical protein
MVRRNRLRGKDQAVDYELAEAIAAKMRDGFVTEDVLGLLALEGFH